MNANKSTNGSNIMYSVPFCMDERIQNELQRKHVSINASDFTAYRVPKQEDKSSPSDPSLNVHAVSAAENYSYNVLTLYKLAHREIDSSMLSKLWRHKERRAWKRAKKIAKSIGFPLKDENSDNCWDKVMQQNMHEHRVINLNTRFTVRYLLYSLLAMVGQIVFILFLTSLFFPLNGFDMSKHIGFVLFVYKVLSPDILFFSFFIGNRLNNRYWWLKQ